MTWMVHHIRLLTQISEILQLHWYSSRFKLIGWPFMIINEFQEKIKYMKVSFAKGLTDNSAFL